jgi:hypothetical protein
MPSRYVKVSTGLKLCSASRTGSELGDIKIVIPKIYRGNKLHDRQKTKKIVTTPLSPKITGSNIAKIFSLADSESNDIAVDASQWSSSIKEIYNAIKYDIMAIYHIPLVFSISDVNVNYPSIQLDTYLYPSTQTFLTGYYDPPFPLPLVIAITLAMSLPP